MIDLQGQDIDPIETKEWVESLASVIERDSVDRAQFLVSQLSNYVQSKGGITANAGNTPYCNTIKPEKEIAMPDDGGIAKRVSALIRWNAVAMVLRAGKYAPELGGHIASYASAATLYEVGFDYFFKGVSLEKAGDLIYFQGHSSPGIYARAFLEGRLSMDHLERFRQEVDGGGLSSYPHPWLMPDFWQFATVSMGLGPLQAIYQARFLKYLHNRKLVNAEGRKVWAFLGDGEMDEPESLGCISLAAREKLDNLIFVVNCNLQRLDGPVRGNGSIIQELESIFRGAGWHVIKVIWGSKWDPLFAKDKDGLLLKRMHECVDGDYQTYKAHDGAYVRKHFFGKYPELLKMVEHLSDEEIWHLNRGGHDPQKIYAAYHEATHHKNQPVVILAKTIKGYGMGTAGEGQNITHQQKKMSIEELRAFRDRFALPLTDKEVETIPFYRPEENSPEITYLQERRQALGGYLPARLYREQPLAIPPLSKFESIYQESGDRAVSTTMAFVRMLNLLLKEEALKSRIVPIVPDESRTFGMEGMFRQYGIYSPIGQLYTPVDSEQLMYYKEATDGQMLEEGINEAGAFCSWLAAATSYSTHQYPMIPFYIYYSMFGFQRIGDLAWAAGDMRARGFLLGATSGRTTLAGEGLQHTDGHSHIFAGVIPNCKTYDPTFSYELAVIIQHGLKEMYEECKDVFYYITVMNENYNHPALKEAYIDGILKGMYLFKESKLKATHQVHLLGSGAILREVIKASEYLENECKVAAHVWSVTSFNELKREAMQIERENRFQMQGKAKLSYVAQCLNQDNYPVIAATDYIRLYADQIRSEISKPYVVLGTDGFGRSDTREKLREFFEVNYQSIVLAALKTLVERQEFSLATYKKITQTFKINANKPTPFNI